MAVHCMYGVLRASTCSPHSFARQGYGLPSLQAAVWSKFVFLPFRCLCNTHRRSNHANDGECLYTKVSNVCCFVKLEAQVIFLYLPSNTILVGPGRRCQHAAARLQIPEY
ncbi:hypothetical protein V8C42DRAFT_305543 [Trichoderma barbatum]